jgi:hypothetical protein
LIHRFLRSSAQPEGGREMRAIAALATAEKQLAVLLFGAERSEGP